MFIAVKNLLEFLAKTYAINFLLLGSLMYFKWGHWSSLVMALVGWGLNNSIYWLVNPQCTLRQFLLPKLPPDAKLKANEALTDDEQHLLSKWTKQLSLAFAVSLSGLIYNFSTITPNVKWYYILIGFAAGYLGMMGYVWWLKLILKKRAVKNSIGRRPQR